MRIGVDATCWQNRRGYGRHARALLRSVIALDTENQYTLFLDSAEGAETLPPRADVRFIQSDTPTVSAAGADGSRSPRDLWRVSRAISSERFDLLLYPTIYSYVPVFTSAFKMVMIHDVIAETYPKLTVPRLSSRLFWKAKVALGCMQADAIVTVSEYSRHGIMERFGLRPERVHVVGEASDPVFRVLDHPQVTPRLRALGIDGNGPVIVYVGGFGPHKNLEELLSAFAEVSRNEKFSNAKLVMVGDFQGDVFHSQHGTLVEIVERAGIRDRVQFAGFLPDEELVVLLNLATVLALPSLMEGFGLPAVEAAACGCPVIVTRNSPLPDLLGDGAIAITPQRNELAPALAQVLSSEPLQRRMRKAAVEAAARLTWDAAARQLMTVMRAVVN